MRAPILLLAAFAALVSLAGCERTIERTVNKAVSEQAAAPGQEWSLQIVGSADDNGVFVVTGPDGQRAAARVTDGTSALIDDSEAHGLLSEAHAVVGADDLQQKVAIAAPGFSLKVSADEDDSSGHGQVRIKAGGVSINVDGADADSKSGGVVQIGGVNEEAARKFIDGIDNLSPEVKQQMRAKLGL